MGDQAMLERQAAALQSAPIAASALDAKARITLTAKACLAGVVLHFLDDDRGAPLIVATKWALTKQMRTAIEVEDFLRRLGGPSA